MAKDVVHAVLAVLTGLFACVVVGKYSAFHRQMMQDFYGETTICRTTPGLTREQMKVCQRQPDTTSIALQGLTNAVQECQHQFSNHRWNCSSLSTRTGNPYTASIFQKGYRESAFASAISSASVVISVARACSQGSLINCGCDTHKYKVKGKSQSLWKWAGCNHNLHYGTKFSKHFLDFREKGEDIHSEVTLHNNQVGRTAVKTHMQLRCKCHGLSGSCEQKTCWRSVPDIRIVSKALKDKYKTAVLVDQSNLVNKRVKNPKKIAKNARARARLQWTPTKRLRKKHLKHELLFYEKSPNFCEQDASVDVFGTSGRICNRSTFEQGSCSTMCCGRGYNQIKQRRVQACNCKFQWCCKVECEECVIEEWISICK